jgi:ribonuclease HII
LDHPFERTLIQAGFELVAGADEAGRGACAGPLVAAAVILDPDAPILGLDDSKRLTPAARERLYARITESALAWSVVSVPPAECDRAGMQAANLAALRRAVTRLDPAPDFALVDGFAVDGLGLPSLGVWKGDQVAPCVSAASIVAKVTRDRTMAALADTYPEYRFDIHKGYCTELHQGLLEAHGPSPVHRWCFKNVVRAARAHEASSGRSPSPHSKVAP